MPRSAPAQSSNIRGQAAKAIVEKVISKHERIILQPHPGDETVSLPEDDENRAPRAGAKICIVGAGSAGLYAAMLLDTLGIEYDILEANTERIGGRLYTHRFNGEAGRKAKVNDPARYDYIDMGAMRYPNITFMDRVFDLFDRLEMEKDNLLIEYKYSVANSFSRYNDVLVNGTPTGDAFNVSETKGGTVPDEWITEKGGVDEVAKGIFEPYADEFKINFQAGWKKLTAQDKFSTRGYLLGNSYPEVVVEWLETFETATGLYNQAFVESTMDAMDFSSSAPAQTAKPLETTGPRKFDWYCIDGGSDNISERMLATIRFKPIQGCRATKIRSTAHDTMEVEYQNPAGQRVTTEYGQVISTVPLGCLAAIDFPDSNDLSYTKRIAIRALNYDTSTKVALRFQTRWWEDPQVMKKHGPIKGGASNTDMPIRTCVYPSYGWHATGPLPGVLLASYTWAQDAQRLGGLAQGKDSEAYKQLIELILDDLARLHDVTREQMGPLLDSYALDWHSDPLARGAFALFGPGQFGYTGDQGESLFASMKAPGANGKLHIAGEATSVHHAWVLGALNSGWRAVYNALDRYPNAEKKRKDLIAKWGIPDEEDPEHLLKLALLAKAMVL